VIIFDCKIKNKSYKLFENLGNQTELSIITMLLAYKAPPLVSVQGMLVYLQVHVPAAGLYSHYCQLKTIFC